MNPTPFDVTSFGVIGDLVAATTPNFGGRVLEAAYRAIEAGHPGPKRLYLGTEEYYQLKEALDGVLHYRRMTSEDTTCSRIIFQGMEVFRVLKKNHLEVG